MHLSADVTAFAPSETAVTICLNCFVRTSPAAKIPSILVAQVSSATIYPDSSVLTLERKAWELGVIPGMNFFWKKMKKNTKK